MKTTKKNYKPLRNEVLIEYIVEDNETESGLLLPENRARGKYHRGKAIRIGPRCYEVKPGDICYIHGSWAGTELETNLFMISEDVIFGVEIN